VSVCIIALLIWCSNYIYPALYHIVIYGMSLKNSTVFIKKKLLNVNCVF